MARNIIPLKPPGAGAQDILQAGETEAGGNDSLRAVQGGLGSFRGVRMLWVVAASLSSASSVPGFGTEQPDPEKTSLCHPGGHLTWVPGGESRFQSCIGVLNVDFCPALGLNMDFSPRGLNVSFSPALVGYM